MMNNKELKEQIKANKKAKKALRKFYQKKRFIIPVVFIILIAVSSMGSKNKTVVTKDKTIVAEKKVATPTPAKPTVPTEYISALAKAQTYGDTMSMSKTGIYDQLTSEYGEKFSKKSAQYAIDNVKIDWKENALKKAQTYQKEMSMSPSAIYDQLVSANGEKFTPSEAQYAKDNLK